MPKPKCTINCDCPKCFGRGTLQDDEPESYCPRCRNGIYDGKLCPKPCKAQRRDKPMPLFETTHA